ncbi:carbonic anhydrase [Aspergillus granulosus]|uniref:Carbonic anhydrase n=1 Tax=Aspergillus granulosus TaxID=176169 RepID=A0ABR4HF82_9EURO
MPSSSTLATLLARNATYATTHTPIPTNTQIKTSSTPAYKTLIISCTDGRISPDKFLDIQTPHEFLIHRNSGGRAKPALPNLLALDDLVTIETVLVIGHTDCGARTFDEEMIRATLKQRASGYEDVVASLEFGRIAGSVEDSVKEDVKFIKESPLVRDGLKDSIFGLVFDIKTGVLERVA